eukprot:3344642-Rhodomonas_salina.1
MIISESFRTTVKVQVGGETAPGPFKFLRVRLFHTGDRWLGIESAYYHHAAVKGVPAYTDSGGPLPVVSGSSSERTSLTKCHC